MRGWRVWVLSVALAGLICVFLRTLTHGDAPTSPAPPSQHESGAEFFADQTSECDVYMLDLSVSEAGPFKRVLPVGTNLPHEILRRNVWEHGRYRVRGRFTGKDHFLPECGNFPEFEVLEFHPWGDVQRCVSPGAMDPIMLLYTEDLPKDRYVPEDLADGPYPRLIDDMSCRRIAACAVDKRHPGARVDPQAVVDGDVLPPLDGRYCHPEVQCREAEKRVTSCAGIIWCCRLEPEEDASSPATQEP